MKEWMAQADLLKGARMFERMNGRPQLLFSNKLTHYLIEIFFPYKTWFFYTVGKLVTESN